MSVNVSGKTTEAKAPYEAPRLRVYGDVRDMTQAVGNMGGDDGGGSPNHKSSI